MSVSVREQLKALQFLQEIDSKAEGLKKQKNAFSLQLKPLQDKVEQLTQKIRTKNQEVEEAQKFERQAVAAIEICQDRLTRSGSRMESVSKGNEYQALNREIDQLKKQIETLKTQLQAAKANVETKTAELAQAQEEQSQAQQEREQIQAQLQEQSEKLDQSLAGLDAERAPFVSQVERKVLIQYDRIRGARAGVGLAPAWEGRCKLCNVILPPQLYILIQRAQDFHQCPSCSRLLFFAEAALATSSSPVSP